VWTAWRGELSEEEVVCHKDLNLKNTQPSNLIKKTKLEFLLKIIHVKELL
jgi:hypothetical protein